MKNNFTIAITTTFKPDLISRSRLESYKYLVSVLSRNVNASSRSRALMSRSHTCHLPASSLIMLVSSVQSFPSNDARTITFAVMSCLRDSAYFVQLTQHNSAHMPIIPSTEDNDNAPKSINFCRLRVVGWYWAKRSISSVNAGALLTSDRTPWYRRMQAVRPTFRAHAERMVTVTDCSYVKNTSVCA